MVKKKPSKWWATSPDNCHFCFPRFHEWLSLRLRDLWEVLILINDVNSVFFYILFFFNNNKKNIFVFEGCSGLTCLYWNKSLYSEQNLRNRTYDSRSSILIGKEDQTKNYKRSIPLNPRPLYQLSHPLKIKNKFWYIYIYKILI